MEHVLDLIGPYRLLGESIKPGDTIEQCQGIFNGRYMEFNSQMVILSYMIYFLVQVRLGGHQILLDKELDHINNISDRW